MEDLCIRCGGTMVHIGFKIYRCTNCGHEEKPEDVM
jgi:tRNA(Ile2) C34 agmatinyltransferase TiaS